MKIKKRYIFLAVIFVILTISLSNLPFLFDGKESKEMMVDDEKIIVISDLHLDSNFRDLTCIGDYLKKENVSLLILNGDVFDKRYKTPLKNEDFVYLQSRLGIKDNSFLKVIYLPSLYNHDPYLNDIQDLKKDNIEVFKGILNLKTGNDDFYIFHGDYILSGYNTGIASIINKLSANLIYEQFAKAVTSKEKDGWFILSHSHIPGIDYQNNVANTGCWINRYISNTDTAILINGENDSTVNLIKIPCEE